jgi:IS30 family transposase
MKYRTRTRCHTRQFIEACTSKPAEPCEELLQHLRRYRAMRRSRSHTQKTQDHGRISNAISISDRPSSVEDRAVPGHWEGDLIFGANNCQIAI